MNTVLSVSRGLIKSEAIGTLMAGVKPGKSSKNKSDVTVVSVFIIETT